jgi:hypothetical protein
MLVLMMVLSLNSGRRAREVAAIFPLARIIALSGTRWTGFESAELFFFVLLLCRKRRRHKADRMRKWTWTFLFFPFFFFYLSFLCDLLKILQNLFYSPYEIDNPLPFS